MNRTRATRRVVPSVDSAEHRRLLTIPGPLSLTVTLAVTIQIVTDDPMTPTQPTSVGGSPGVPTGGS